MGKILVFGANGTVGRPLVKTLVAQGHDVRTASRRGMAVEGAEGVIFDYSQPGSLAEIFEA